MHKGGGVGGTRQEAAANAALHMLLLQLLVLQALLLHALQTPQVPPSLPGDGRTQQGETGQPRCDHWRVCLNTACGGGAYLPLSC